MQRNVGTVDRIIRVVVGLVIIVIGFVYQSWWGAVGLIPLLTGAIGWCPAYLPFNIKTNKS
ncbi:MAG: DUF2892 domain-containing protein [Leptospiraceae bacterium]|nr:DUF2892 domain-containing protein [Leptospiraceae bacterium]MDW7975134.1 DUF2892 domain-containing protein [Leptospiraceae bacterium]